MHAVACSKVQRLLGSCTAQLTTPSIRTKDVLLPAGLKQLVVIPDKELRVGIVTARDANPTADTDESEKQHGMTSHLAETEDVTSIPTSPGGRPGAMRRVPGMQATSHLIRDASWYIQVVSTNCHSL